MQNISKVFINISILFVAAILLSACTNNSENNSQNISSAQTDSSSNTSTGGTSSQQTDLTKISAETLAENDGKNGNDCYVAIDGTVYEISGVSEWQNGEHTTTTGVSCGRDLSQEINQSPHGKQVLSGLEVVGELE